MDAPNSTGLGRGNGFPGPSGAPPVDSSDVFCGPEANAPAHQDGVDMAAMGRQLLGPSTRALLDIDLVLDAPDVGMPTIHTTGIKAMAMMAAENDSGLMMWGAPGIGKTAIASELGSDRALLAWSNERSGLDLKALQVVVLNAPEMGAEDLLGVPTIKDVIRNYQDGRQETARVTVWGIPEKFDPTRPCILFIDEPNRCDQSVRNALFALVNGGTMSNGFKLPEGSVVIAAGNRMQDRVNVRKMDDAWNNRFMHAQVQCSVDGWLDWAQEQGLSPVVRGFIKRHEKALSNSFDSESPEECKPSPRSWAKVGKAWAKTNYSPAMRDAAAQASVGKAMAQMLKAFAKNEAAIPDPKILRENPDAIVIPKESDLDTAWVLAMAIGDLMAKQPEPGKNIMNDPLALGIAKVMCKLVLVHPEAAMYALESSRKAIYNTADKSAMARGEKTTPVGPTIWLGVAATLGKDDRFRQYFKAIVDANKGN